jgi:hypothetical protein
MKILLIFLITNYIKINVENVFENEKFPYNIFNFLHIKTKESKVKKIIFFNENKKDTFLLKESERRLRGLGIFKYVEIKSSKDSDTIYINLKDLFTSSVFTSLQGGGGKAKFTFGVEEHNFLGKIIDAGIFYVRDYERDYLNFFYFEPSFLNSIFDIYLSSNFGKNYEAIDFFVKRPHFLFLKNFPYLNYQKVKKFKYVYEDGEKIDSIRFLYEKFLTGFLKNFNDKKWNAYGLEFEGIKDSYRKFFSLNAVYLIGNERYTRKKFIRKFGEIEDMFNGWKINIKVKTDFKNNGTEINFYTGLNFLNILLDFSGYYQNYYYKNYNFSLLIFYPLIERITFGNLFLFSKPFEKIYVGGLNGLRGYPAYYFDTKEYFLNQSEIRFFGFEIFKIFAPGFVIFYDCAKFKERKKIYSNFGIGLRIEFTRNYNLPILRFDIAFKNLKSKGIYSFGEGQSF